MTTDVPSARGLEQPVGQTATLPCSPSGRCAKLAAMLLAPPMTAAPSQRLPQHLARRHALPLLVLLSVASCTPQGQDVDAGPKPLDPAQYAVYLTRFPFGGRTTEAWAARLNELKSGPQANADLYALTVARAQANGLVVDDGASVTVKPGPAVSAIILRRLQP